MWQMETDHGGLVRALLAKRRERRAARAAGHLTPIGSPLGRLTSFRAGVEELPQALARRLGARLRLSAPVERLEPADPGGYRLVTRGEVVEADVAVLATPAAASATLVERFDATLAAELRQIRTAPVAVVALGYDGAALPRPLAGFGFLVPRGEGPRVLGVLWDSSIYPGRAPQGKVLLRAMIGGARDPDVVGWDDDALLAAVREDLRRTMGVSAAPELVRIFRHRLGIPQYGVGHVDRLSRIDARLDGHRGLLLAGNSYRGVAMNSCILEASQLASRLKPLAERV
jgi:oxygen-dependent protoporphyrinogen oxidase